MSAYKYISSYVQQSYEDNYQLVKVKGTMSAEKLVIVDANFDVSEMLHTNMVSLSAFPFLFNLNEAIYFNDHGERSNRAIFMIKYILAC